MMNRCIYLFLLISFAVVSCKSPKNASTTTTNNTTKTKLTEKQQIDFTYLYFNATKEKNLGNVETAIGLYQQCLRINPNDPAPMYELANLLNQQGSPRNALPFAAKAAELEPNNEWYSLLLADCYLKTKNYNEAIKVYQKLIKNFPARLDFYEELAIAQLYAGKGDDAIKTYDKLESLLGGINESISMQKLNLYKQLGKEDKLLLEINRLITAFPKEYKYYGMLGEYYMSKGQKEKAFEAYQKLREVDPGNGFVHLSLSEYYRALKEDDKSYSEMKLAFQNSEIDIDTKIKILLSYYYKVSDSKPELKEQGIELSRILTEVYPDDAKSFSVHGDFLYRDNRSKEAKEYYLKAIALDKERYLLWSQLLLIESELSDFESMYTESSQTIELFPNQPFPYLMKGVAAIQKKKNEEAIEILNQGVELVIDNKPLLGQFYSSLGDAYNAIQNHALSDKSYERSLAIDSNNTFVLNNYSYYLSLRNEKLERAEQMSKRSNQLSPDNSSFLDTYAWILYQLKRYNEAEEWIKKAIDNGGKNSSVILEHYGDILWKQNKTEEAVKLWNEAKEKGTGSEFLDKKVSDKKLYE